MKVLILSCNTGGGHNSAAAAIKDYFEKNGSRCDIVNALDFLPEELKKYGKNIMLCYGRNSCRDAIVHSHTIIISKT